MNQLHQLLPIIRRVRRPLVPLDEVAKPVAAEAPPTVEMKTEDEKPDSNNPPDKPVQHATGESV